MINVSIVDDDVNALSKLKQELTEFFKNKNLDVEIQTFSSGLDYLAQMPNTDILFLDVEMPSMNGIDVAKEIRKTNQDVLIFFCTIYQQFAINGYEVNALGYMVKPIKSYSLTTNLEHALQFLDRKKKDEEKKIELHTFQSIIVFPLSDLLYVEVKRHNLFYNLRKNSDYPEKQLKIRGTMNTLYSSLKNDNFEKCGNSFLINLEYVASVRGDIVILKDKTEVPLSRMYKDTFMSAFSRFLIKKGSIVL